MTRFNARSGCLILIALLLLITPPIIAVAEWLVRPETVQHVARASVQIQAGNSIGSGLMVERVDGVSWYLTCAHVVGTETNVDLLFGDDGTPTGTGRVTFLDKQADLALIITADSPVGVRPIPLAETPPLTGASIFIVGSPQAIPYFASFGWVASQDRVIEGGGPPRMVLDFTATPGESGSGICNDKGEIVGVIRACLPGTRIGIGVTLHSIRKFLKR